MEKYKLVSDYRHDDRLKESFNDLAIKTFGLDFRDWYNKGYWNDQYIPYSFVQEGKVIANASVYKMSIRINGEQLKGIQIGTVMTDEHYRHQGLAKQLMLHIMKEYEGACDFMYLFANETVLDFYPKFGFTRIHESEFSLDLTASPIQRQQTSVQQLTVEQDLALLEDYAKNRYIHSSMIAVEQNESLLMFYCTLVFPHAIYYLEELETIVFMEEEEGVLNIFDIISLQPIHIEELLANIVKDSTQKVVFYFTPEFTLNGMTATIQPNDDDALFVLSKKAILQGNFMFPLTSHC
ncbi:GNAT family N-acetyltransferase [Lysinibacillus sp. FSL M8-0216]|uniref:Ribosomal protein S18 acetylase RimI n=1 Tax=Lysinibacillus fusiformis TaxID=28031 RepID=A0A1H9MPB4_9BACI|nr:GNAT family N-acetyltransferase [Lysinibacillus fusiformis]MCG7434990.1 GNAT family N-acetyltransferase [Lysinibacillus fusiformis]SCX41294.1 Ribosomal protein S18 acetylase RimI [Lysinibacillus fusiformis]SCY61006.1 Ribosomal protein S18 acetylase RimI [Lysinibacillus fusiformis]SDB10406.1 Ribosomal protein S18 acetylase RimI [Lysinibacillus fusiformis]SEN98944.1 Ribosomal protein S18 acetylase RimI [Lysinibacillus fusiformis]